MILLAIVSPFILGSAPGWSSQGERRGSGERLVWGGGQRTMRIGVLFTPSFWRKFEIQIIIVYMLEKTFTSYSYSNVFIDLFATIL